MPEEAWRISERHRIAAALQASADSVQFSKEPWVRPAASAYQEEQSMRKGSMAALAATALLLGGNTAGASSEPVAVNTSPTRHGHWSRVCTNAVQLTWEWREESAVRADLTLTGLRGGQTHSFTRPATNWEWQVSATTVPAEEDVVDLTLVFYDAQDTVTSEQSARLSVLPGAFGATPVVMSETGKRWTRVREAAVIPYDACWTEATAPAPAGRLVIGRQDGLAQTNLLDAAAGYYGWKLRGSSWGYGAFDLALDFPESAGLWDAVLVRVPEGFMIRVR